MQPEPTECPKRIELRQNVYAILAHAEMREGSQPSLLRLAANPEWKAFIHLLYSHIRTCPLCSSKSQPHHPGEPRPAHEPSF